MARQLLISLLDAFNESESDNDLLNQIDMDTTQKEIMMRSLIFHRCFKIYKMLKPELQGLSLYNQSHSIRKTITLFGQIPEDDFWADLEKKYPVGVSGFPSFAEFKSVAVYGQIYLE